MQTVKEARKILNESDNPNFTKLGVHGRTPKLRNLILDIIVNSDEELTMADIASAVKLNSSTPYRPLMELVNMNLLEKKINSNNKVVWVLNESEYKKRVMNLSKY